MHEYFTTGCIVVFEGIRVITLWIENVAFGKVFYKDVRQPLAVVLVMKHWTNVRSLHNAGQEEAYRRSHGKVASS